MTVKHHTIPVATVEQIDWHLRNLFNSGWKTVEEISFDEHVRRHTDGRSGLQWVNNLTGSIFYAADESAVLRMEGLL